MSKNVNLHKAKSDKYDEFYTQLVDIEAELKHYQLHFKDKVVLCNCDDASISNFYRYFHQNFQALGLKKLIASCYKSHYDFLFNDGDKAFYTQYDGDSEIKILFQVDGDFRSAECIDLLQQADIVVTNPPFSLFREYLTQLVTYNKKFLIVGAWNAVTYKGIFHLIKDGDVWPGMNSNRCFSGFIVPENYPLRGTEARIDDDGNRIVSLNNTCWFTNLPNGKRNELIPLTKKYSPAEYPKYDNYDAINVGKVTDIPLDYDGVMGVPITFLDKFNPNQFEIVGITKTWWPSAIKTYPPQTRITPTGKRRNDTMLNAGPNIEIDGPIDDTYYISEGKYYRQTYARILIRHVRN